MAKSNGSSLLSTRIEATREEFLQVVQSVQTLDLSARESQIKILEAKADMLIIANEDGERGMTNLVMQLKAIGDELEDRRKTIKQPALDWGDMTDSAFRPLIDRVQSAIGRSRTKVENYHQKLIDERRRKEEEARRESERLAQEAARKESEAKAKADELLRQAEVLRKQGEAEAAAKLAAKAERVEEAGTKKAEALQNASIAASYVHPPAAKTTVSSSGASSTTKLVWDYEIIKLNIIPMQFWEINNAMIREVGQVGIKATGKPTEIPGIRWFQKSQVAFRK